MPSCARDQQRGGRRPRPRRERGSTPPSGELPSWPPSSPTRPPGTPRSPRAARALRAEAAALAALRRRRSAPLAARPSRARHAVERASRAEALATGFADLAAARAAVLPRGAARPAARLVTASGSRSADRLRGALAAAEFAGLDAGRCAASSRRAAGRGRAEQLDAADARARRLAWPPTGAAEPSTRFAAARADVEAARREHDDIGAEAAPVVHLAKLARAWPGSAGSR